MKTKYDNLLTHRFCYDFLRGVVAPVIFEDDDKFYIKASSTISKESGEIVARFKVYNEIINAIVCTGWACFTPYYCNVNLEPYWKDDSKINTYRFKKEYASYVSSEIKKLESKGESSFTSLEYIKDYNNYCAFIRDKKIQICKKAYDEQILPEESEDIK